MRKGLAILGSSGTIGEKALEEVRAFKNQFSVVSLAVHSNIEVLEKQVYEFKPKIVAIFDEEKANLFKLKNLEVKVVSGIEGIIEAATYEGIDLVVMAICGSIALLPTVEAIKANKRIALASKEVLVCAGEFIMNLCKEKENFLIPIDSEHSAIFQCLKKEKAKKVKRLILTASGGPFWNSDLKDLKSVTVEQALRHNYKMGKKNTIDSSTMMNKGLEIIEAYWLFGIENIDVIVHRESLVHSFVEFVDGSMLAEVSEPDMRIPIHYALFYPRRHKMKVAPFDFERFKSFTFFQPNDEKFPSIKLAREALRIGKSMPCFMNAANEVLVNRFLKGEIDWLSISHLLEKLMSLHKVENMLDLNAILSIDKEGREKAKNV